MRKFSISMKRIFGIESREDKLLLSAFAIVVLLILGAAWLTRDPAMIALSQQTDRSGEYQMQMNAEWHKSHVR